MQTNVIELLAVAGRKALLLNLEDAVGRETDAATDRLRLPDPLELPKAKLSAIEEKVIRDWLRENLPNKAGKKWPHKRDWIVFGGLRIDWPARLPGLKPWSGAQKLDAIFCELADLVLRSDAPVLDATGTVKSLSGMDQKSIRANALDLGFSPAIVQGWEISAGRELLAIVALALEPVVCWSDGTYSLFSKPDRRFIRRSRGQNSYYGSIVAANGNP